ncbi:hypothetical protein [Mesoterricola silvestris]|uniref:Mor transcription activator domain-containing protein n=1 Tax=Mesoterricola silvestris TaxID=2927979 RepID=A0AA48GQJ4_9BACT|nr:hypothetical protein [Mesoterricola silvestris]BDU72375.1 hypothetical protein METEAL_15490 [Mesoterricola silvestris]
MACRPLPEKMDESLPTAAEILLESMTELLIGRGIQEPAAGMIARRQLAQLLNRLGGGYVWLPRTIDYYTRTAKEDRNAMVLDMVRQGHPKEVILRVVNLKKSQFYNIIRRKKAG